MNLKSITKSQNSKRIRFYYVFALVFVGVGLFSKDPRWYVIGVAFLSLALFRKYILMKRLKD